MPHDRRFDDWRSVYNDEIHRGTQPRVQPNPNSHLSYPVEPKPMRPTRRVRLIEDESVVDVTL